MLRSRDHLRKALETDFQASHVRRNLIQHISIAYLRGLEDLKDEKGLFTQILQNWKQEDISEIISFFWGLGDEDVEEGTRGLILDMWKLCYEKIRGQEDENRLILSDLNLLTVFLAEMSDDQKAWLLQSSPYVEEKYHGDFFLEYLDRLTDQNSEKVADIYLKMLTRTAPTYDQKNVRSIIEKLYEAGLSDKANDICDTYARKGHPDLLKALYNRYNP